MVINPSGGALVANPVMATGLVRIGEAFRQVHDHGRQRVLGHASSGPCLQQNLVCVLEGGRPVGAATDRGPEVGAE